MAGQTSRWDNPTRLAMGVIVDLCIAACEKVLTEAGLKIQLHPNGKAIEACHQAVHAMGCPASAPT